MTSDLELLNEARRLLKKGTRLALCTVIEKKGSGPREAGTKMIVSEDEETYGTIGGGAIERTLINVCMDALKERTPRTVTFNATGEKKTGMVKMGLMCGGEVSVFIDTLEPDLQLILVGAGHVALSLARLADIMGFQMTIIDDDCTLANKERFPMAERIVTGDVVKVVSELILSSSDFVVVAYGDHKREYVALKSMIEKKPAYLGLLSSKAKAATFVKRLRTEGISEAHLKILHAPIGLAIGAETPEEIGISILAEIIQYKRTKRE
ncbi:MAG TPA: XdhC family protein [Candidatus Acidoferrales bacterium]|nr:XdhC family protein [Candidatus Acidoferrales bacterium]